ncbi:uncharacterized protein METZ01_LOCUS218060 [marine metagenome]|uniref:Uncharacterized protein n=1 Tax=marine metagenome TaxID=408172 RepID=A0A382FQ03_9ZZZZ
MGRVTRCGLANDGQIYIFRGIVIDGCDLLDVNRHTSVFCHKVSENVGGVYEAFNPPILYQKEMITGDPEVVIYAGMALMCTTWPIGFAHVCIPIGAALVYNWFQEVFHLWGII